MQLPTASLPRVFSSISMSPARPDVLMVKRTTTLPLSLGFRLSSFS